MQNMSKCRRSVSMSLCRRREEKWQGLEVSAVRPPVFASIHQSPNALSSFYLSLNQPFFPALIFTRVHLTSLLLLLLRALAFSKLVASLAPLVWSFITIKAHPLIVMTDDRVANSNHQRFLSVVHLLSKSHRRLSHPC